MNFVKVPVQQLLSKEYGDKRRALIDLDKSGTYQAGKVSHGPYMTVADKEGNMVSNSKQLQRDGFWNGSLNWALCYKIEGII
jgi:gamma-glutamyltranspeptidase